MIEERTRRDEPASHLQGYLGENRLLRVRGSQQQDVVPSAPSDGQLAVWLTGTGTPAVLPDRAGPSNLVRCGKDVILVDSGNSTAYQLARLGLLPNDLSHIFITHHHIDHNVDLPFLLISPWIESLARGYQPPTVVGPPGTVTFVERLFALHEYDLRVRTSHGYDPRELVPPVVEVSDGSVVRGEGWQAVAFEVDHHPVDAAFGFRFDAGGMAVVFSGDTRPCDNLVSYARSADILVHEALYPGYGIPEYHTLSTEVGGVAARAEVGHLVLTHLLPGHLPEDAWREHVSEHFSGQVTVGSDLLRVL